MLFLDTYMQGRTQGGCTGCTCIPPPRPCALCIPPPAWKAGYEKRWGSGQQEKKCKFVYLRHFYQISFSIFWAVACELGFKVKKLLIWHKNISLAKFDYKNSNNAKFYAYFKTDEKTTKLQAKKVSKIWVCSFSINNLLKFSANNFFQGHLFPIISTYLKSA